MAFSGNIYCLFSTARIKLIVYHARISTLNIFSFVFNSLSDASFLANNYTTQWSDDKTCPVHVTENMDHYLMSQALHIGLGDFNRKNLIAATFTKHNGTGKPAESGCLCLFRVVCVCLSLCLSGCLSWRLCLFVCLPLYLLICLFEARFIDKFKFYQAPDFKN